MKQNVHTAPGFFCITAGKGFHVTFANGWTVSVQWGGGDYGDHYHVDDDDPDVQRICGERGSTRA